ncbi:MAG: hypothetical protein KC421_15085 [Anaerolineales bacterium]|nr:hypothetical protein [Anaerolineales bacterium]
MTKTNHSQQTNVANTAVSPIRVVFAFIIPLAGALLFSTVAGGISNAGLQAPLFAGLGIAAWFLGLRWYGLPGMGLRGQRPLFSGIGFATLGWIAFLIFRFVFVDIDILNNADGNNFMYILTFEAFALQIWAFGTLFHAVADWRGPLTAAVSTGIVFGAVALLLFQEAFVTSWDAVIYFVIWGVFYGIIRLRTGSFLGIIIIQTLQTFTGWLVLLPILPPNPAQLRPFYLITAAVYLIFIWRLWPKVEEDYRV